MSNNNYIFFCEHSQQDGFPAIGQEEPLKLLTQNTLMCLDEVKPPNAKVALRQL